MAQYLFGLMTLSTELSTPIWRRTNHERPGHGEHKQRAFLRSQSSSECYYLKGKMYRYQNNFLDAMVPFVSVNSDPSFIISYEAGFNVSIELGYPDQAKSWLAEGIERNQQVMSSLVF